MILGLILACAIMPNVHLMQNISTAGRGAPSLYNIETDSRVLNEGIQERSQSVVGPVSLVVLLVEFSDMKHVASKEAVRNLVFVVMGDYYRQVSYGRVEVTGNVTDWMTLGHPMKYYGADTGGDIDPNSSRLLSDAVAAAEPSVDFRQYQNVMVMHAGNGQESEGDKTDDVWSVYYDGLSIVTNSGIAISAGEIVPENEANAGLKACFGVVAHEFGHYLGLPDLYDERGRLQSRDYVGPWSLMAGGSWLGKPDGSAPSELEAYSRILLGWLQPQELGQAETALVVPLELWSGTRAIKVSVPDSDAYYLIEDRRRFSYDQSLPSEGLLITYVRPTAESGSGIVRVINANSSNTKLNYATFHGGDTYADEEHSIYFTIQAQGDGFKIELSPAPPLYAKLTDISSATVSYDDSTTLTARVLDEKGNALSGLVVMVSYFDGSSFVLLGQCASDAQGICSTTTRIRVTPGEYRLTYNSVGTLLEGRFIWPANATATLTVTRGALRISVPSDQLYAFESQRIRVRILDEFNRPVANVSVSFLINGRFIGKAMTSPSGYAATTYIFDPWNTGNQNLRLEVDGGRDYLSNATSKTVSILIPDWFYKAVFTALLVGIVVVLEARQLREHSIGSNLDQGRQLITSNEAPLQMKYCLNCGQPIRIDARFCTNIRCGAPQDRPRYFRSANHKRVQ